MEKIIEIIMPYITTYGLKVIGAIVILIIGRIAAGIGRGIVGKALKKARVDVSVASFVRSLTYFLILTVAIVAALSKFGVQTASLVAVLGAGAFAIGFALKDSLGDFAAGVLLLVLRPFKVGDFVSAAGVEGVVDAIQLFTTVINTTDNIKIMVPNGKIYGDVIKNVTAYDTRRIDLVIGIAYTSSIPKAIEIAMSVLKEHSGVLSDPAPQIAVAELADSSVNLVVRPWVKTEDYWNVRFEVTQKIKEAFDFHGIEIPFPQRSVHMVS